jgi:hypothetical protein
MSVVRENPVLPALFIVRIEFGKIGSTRFSTCQSYLRTVLKVTLNARRGFGLVLSKNGSHKNLKVRLSYKTATCCNVFDYFALEFKYFRTCSRV